MKLTRRQLRNLINEAILNELDPSADRMTGGGAESFGKAHAGFRAIPEEEFKAAAFALEDTLEAIAYELTIDEEDVNEVLAQYDVTVDAYQAAAEQNPIITEGNYTFNTNLSKGKKGEWSYFAWELGILLALVTSIGAFTVSMGKIMKPLKVLKKLFPGKTGDAVMDHLKKSGIGIDDPRFLEHYEEVLRQLRKRSGL
jgi:hypothetical protein